MEILVRIWNILQGFNWLSVCVRLALAVLAGGIVGMERGRHGSAAGLRTHILVCIGSAMTALIGCNVYENMGVQGDVLRIAAQVVSGIGFLGAGMIVIRKNHTITGLTTAAGMWTTAIIGMALGYGFYLGAAVATILCVVTATVLSKMERKRKDVVSYYVEVAVDSGVGAVADNIRKELDENATIVPATPKSNVPNTIGFYITVHNNEHCNHARQLLENMDGIRFCVEE